MRRSVAGRLLPAIPIAFYYDASGIEFSDQTIHLGRYNATSEELAQFEGQDVRVEANR